MRYSEKSGLKYGKRKELLEQNREFDGLSLKEKESMETDLLYVLPFSKQIRGYNLVALAFMSSSVFLVPYLIYNVEYYVGASIMGMNFLFIH
ncbi:hypothetical protein AYI70_g9166 [Smittium culicis]|uniref:Uncharacterized protein n=1 Tax=Smittium culicis TaxID=133412 RepID=A0A1R1XCP8_9FUNG|nr:hypothetical protein AYI70_g9166 [Smittium culicis]